MTLAEVRAFITQLAAANPNAESELNFVDDYTLLVAVVLSAQATDASVNKATVALFHDAPTPRAMVELGEEKVGAHIRTIGLWRTKRAMWSPCRGNCWSVLMAGCHLTARRWNPCPVSGARRRMW